MENKALKESILKELNFDTFSVSDSDGEFDFTGIDTESFEDLTERLLKAIDKHNTPQTPQQHEKKIIEAMYVYLAELAETEDNSNVIDWINNDLDFVAVKFLGKVPDGERQNEIAEQEPKTIDFKEALHLLTVRLNNTL